MEKQYTQNLVRRAILFFNLLLISISLYSIHFWLDSGSCKLPGFFEEAIFSPDEQHVLAIHSPGPMRLYNTKTGELVQTYSTDKPVTNITFSPDGKYIAAGLEDRAVLFDVVTGQELKSYARSRENPNETFGTLVFFVSDGRFLLTGGSEGAVLWDTLKGTNLHTYSGNMLLGNGRIDVSASAQIVMTTDSNAYLIWEISTGRLIHKIDTPLVRHTMLSPDGSVLVTSDERGLIVWSMKDPRAFDVLDGRDLDGRRWNFSPDSQYIVVFSRDYVVPDEVSLWNVRTGKRLHEFSIFQNYDNVVRFTPDSKYVYLPSGTQPSDHSSTYNIDVWDVVQSQLVKRITLDQWSIGSEPFDFSTDGNYWLLEDGTQRLYLRDAIAGAKLLEYC